MSGARPSDRAGAPAGLSPSVSSEAAHPSRGWTRGPWKVDGDKIVEAKGESFICSVSGGDETQDAADRALIAAAPDLYEALGRARRHLRAQHNASPGHYTNATKVDQECAEIDALLAKARGEA